ncbi:mechanosensitive ion channel family protein [Halostreptopolyspora alba]|uniref:Mechanosensitive ion channel family protein n=1 Tax=Halostreptopolyspora alba TaxID=2487137 RepID=A0A3N0E5D4_9ACTN|nr:mechanosensitive ion channel family protein [Nocardiopsaceae bacterium YIM 96095]
MLERDATLPSGAGPLLDWVSQNSGAFIAGAVSVVLILVLAVVARVVVGRVITHVIKRMVSSRERISNGVRNAVNKAAAPTGARQQARADTISSVLRSLASFVIFGVAIVMVLGEFGINLGPILASAGVVGLAIGFGAQGLVQDFLSGIFMMAEDQYGVGDVVDVGEAVGTVEEVGLRITKIRDLDGGLWYVRNGEIARVCNMNQDWANAVVELPLAHTVDVAWAETVIERSVTEFANSPEHESQLLETPTVAGVVGISNGAVTVRTIAKTRPGEQWAVGRALRSHLKSSLDREGIDVAYPVPQIAPT